jgi:hypothetical protein
MRNQFIIPVASNQQSPSHVIGALDEPTATRLIEQGCYRLATPAEVTESGLLSAWANTTAAGRAR